MLLEGKKLIAELETPPTSLIVREGEHPPIDAEQTYIMTKEVFEKISGTHSPEGIAAEINMPPSQDLSNKSWVLALDRMNDPGNMGTLLRSALALGFEGVFLTNSCVDPYNEKALRAAKGATFKLPLEIGNLETFSKNFHLYIADLEGLSIDDTTFESPAILLLGNEAEGVSKEMRKIGTSVTIPLKNQMESLNVAAAGAILMHAMKRQL